MIDFSFVAGALATQTGLDSKLGLAAWFCQALLTYLTQMGD